MNTLVVGVIACFFVAPATALAGQSQTTSRGEGVVRVATLDELRRELSPGDFISVVQTTGDSVRGRLRRFGDTDLDIRVETQVTAGIQRKQRLDVTLPLSALRSLERPRDSSRNGARIGAGIGGGISLAMFVWAFSVDRNEMDEWGPGYLAGAGFCTGLGALAGWAIDRAHSKPHVRFEAPSTGTVTIRAVPLLSRGPGMALAVSF
jgi:hypothetical protein